MVLMIISMCLTPLVATLVQVSPMGSLKDVNHVVFRHFCSWAARWDFPCSFVVWVCLSSSSFSQTGLVECHTLCVFEEYVTLPSNWVFVSYSQENPICVMAKTINNSNNSTNINDSFASIINIQQHVLCFW